MKPLVLLPLVPAALLVAGCSHALGRAAPPPVFSASPSPAQRQQAVVPAPPQSVVQPVPIGFRRLGYWRFDQGDWKGEAGQSPLLATNVVQVQSFDGQAVKIDSPHAADLKYRVVESGGATNLDVRNGSVRFWFQPDWTSSSAGGSGPGKAGFLVDTGAPSSPPTTAWWGLGVTADGNHLEFASQTNGFSKRYLTAPIRWTRHQWHEIILVYSPRASVLYIDSRRITFGPGVVCWPQPAEMAKTGLNIGSDNAGRQQARGSFDNLETFNYPMGLDKAHLGFNLGSFNYPHQMVHLFDSDATLSATAQTSPPEILLNWRNLPTRPLAVQRRVAGTATWTTLTNHDTAWRYVDRKASPGTRYEYRVGDRTIEAGIQIPPVTNRGRVILLVDQTLAGAVEPELKQLQSDLVGDGWQVTRHDVPRHHDADWHANVANIAKIKSLIVSDYGEYSNALKAIFIIGHVAIPFSGNVNPDGHFYRPWPVDAYYGDVVTGNHPWTDTGEHRGRPNNRPGDGMFDQNRIPSALEMAVGRVDFADLPALAPKSEADMLRVYLDKDHRFRFGQLRFDPRASAVGLLWGYVSSINIQLYKNALRNGTAWFGSDPSRILEGDCFWQHHPYLLGMVSAYGNFDRIDGDGPNQWTVANLADPAKKPATAFYLLDGSLMGQWNSKNDLLRALLTERNSGLGSAWNRLVQWRLETLGLGDPISTGLLRTFNDPSQQFYAGNVFLEWMGDPTLRLQIEPPPADVVAESTSQKAVLHWQPSADAAARYLVFRSAHGLDGPFIRLTQDPIDGTAFTDETPLKGSPLYQVRAVGLATTGSGSFDNLSQGAFVTVRH